MTDMPEVAMDVKGLCERLHQCAADAMWADHCEISKRTVKAAATALSTLSRELAEARAERDEARASWKDATEGWDLSMAQTEAALKMFRAAEARALAAEAERDALREALAPFARIDCTTTAGHAFDAWPDDRVVFGIGTDRIITAGDLRRARSTKEPT